MRNLHPTEENNLKSVYSTANYLNSIAWAQLLIQPAATLGSTKPQQSSGKLETPWFYLNLTDPVAPS